MPFSCPRDTPRDYSDELGFRPTMQKNFTSIETPRRNSALSSSRSFWASFARPASFSIPFAQISCFAIRQLWFQPIRDVASKGIRSWAAISKRALQRWNRALGSSCKESERDRKNWVLTVKTQATSNFWNVKWGLHRKMQRKDGEGAWILLTRRRIRVVGCACERRIFLLRISLS